MWTVPNANNIPIKIRFCKNLIDQDGNGLDIWYVEIYVFFQYSDPEKKLEVNETYLFSCLLSSVVATLV